VYTREGGTGEEKTLADGAFHSPWLNVFPPINRYAEFGLSRYKYVVLTSVGEAKSQGIRVATRSIWDERTDAYVSESIQTRNVVAIATLYAYFHG